MLCIQEADLHCPPPIQQQMEKLRVVWCSEGTSATNSPGCWQNVVGYQQNAAQENTCGLKTVCKFHNHSSLILSLDFLDVSIFLKFLDVIHTMHTTSLSSLKSWKGASGIARKRIPNLKKPMPMCSLPGPCSENLNTITDVTLINTSLQSKDHRIWYILGERKWVKKASQKSLVHAWWRLS